MNTFLENTEESQSELSELPDGWINTRLGDIIELSKEKVDPKNCSGCIYIGLENIEKDTGKLLSFNNSESVKSNKAIFQPGEILYGRLRPYLNKIWLANCEGICSTDILVFLKNDCISNKYIFYRFLSKDFVNYSTINSKGVELPRVNYQTISKFIIPLPPLPEQHRIVEKIEEEFTRLDAGVSALKKAKALIPKYRQSVLKAAMCGDLTEEWRAEHQNVESAEVLLERRLRTKNNGITNSAIQLCNLPKTWVWANLISISEVISGFAFKSNDFTSEGVPVIKIANISYGLFLWKHQEYLPTSFLLANSKYQICPDDILIALTRPITGDKVKTCLYPTGAPKGLLNQRVALIKEKSIIAKKYLLYALSSDLFKRQIQFSLSETLQPNLSPKDLKELYVSLPPLEEQHEIVCEIERRFSVIDEMEKAVNDSLAKAERLRQSILKKAFEGRLVPQNPDDEPASVLLERIKAEKEQQAAEEKVRKMELKKQKKNKA